MSLFDRIANTIAPAYGHAQSSAYWLVVVFVGAAGIAGLLYGRRFFWVFAGLLGFLVGQFISGFLVAPLPFVASLFQLAIGVAFGLLAIAFPWTVGLVIAFAGVGAAVGEFVFQAHGSRLTYWIAVIVAGWLGVQAARWAYDETMVGLTAFYSALVLSFVLREVVPRLTVQQALIAMAVMLFVGIVKQGLDLRHERRQPYMVPVSAGGIAPDKLT